MPCRKDIVVAPQAVCYRSAYTATNLEARGYLARSPVIFDVHVSKAYLAALRGSGQTQGSVKSGLRGLEAAHTNSAAKLWTRRATPKK